MSNMTQLTQNQTIAESEWSETRLQAECYKWFHNKFENHRGKLVEVYNNATDKVKGSIRKATGRQKGHSDMNFYWKGKTYHLELKVGKNDLSPEQRAWRDMQIANGFTYLVIRTFDEFKLFVLSTITE